MTLTKKKMISEIGRRTRLKNRDVQAMLETLVEVWTEELVNGGRIELENFLVIDVDTVEVSSTRLFSKRKYRRLRVRASRFMRKCLNIG